MKTYNDNFKGAANNRSNWEMVKEFGTNFVGANAYDYVIIVRKNGERLMCSDAESWEENIKGLRLASVAYCLMWCAFEYSDDQREEAKANGESLTRGVSSVIDFTANEAGYVEYLEEVLANRSNTECEYYNGTTGATAKDNGTADTIAQDHTEHTGESEQYKQLQEAMDALYKLGRTARAKEQKLMHKFCDTLEAEDKAAWIAQTEICHDIDEREEKLQTLWHECQDAWNEYHAPKVAKILAALEAETTEDEPKQETELQRLECREGGELVNLGTGETVGTWGTDENGEFMATLDNNHHYTSVLIVNDPTEGTETTTEDENDTTEDNTPQGGKEAPQSDENEPKGETLAKVAKVAKEAAAALPVLAFVVLLVGCLLSCPPLAYIIVKTYAALPHLGGIDWVVCLGSLAVVTTGAPSCFIVLREIFRNVRA